MKNNCVDEDQSFNGKTESGHGGIEPVIPAFGMLKLEDAKFHASWTIR